MIKKLHLSEASSQLVTFSKKIIELTNSVQTES